MTDRELVECLKGWGITGWLKDIVIQGLSVLIVIVLVLMIVPCQLEGIMNMTENVILKEGLAGSPKSSSNCRIIFTGKSTRTK